MKEAQYAPTPTTLDCNLSLNRRSLRELGPANRGRLAKLPDEPSRLPLVSAHRSGADFHAFVGEFAGPTDAGSSARRHVGKEHKRIEPISTKLSPEHLSMKRDRTTLNFPETEPTTMVVTIC
jgi:hypothetical protein